MKKSKESEDKQDEEVEKMLDTLWDNLASRRSCEQTHTPDYLKSKSKK